MIREFRSLVLVDGMAGIDIGTLYSDFTGFGGDRRLRLRPQLNIELRNCSDPLRRIEHM